MYTSHVGHPKLNTTQEEGNAYHLHKHGSSSVQVELDRYNGLL